LPTARSRSRAFVNDSPHGDHFSDPVVGAGGAERAEEPPDTGGEFDRVGIELDNGTAGGDSELKTAGFAGSHQDLLAGGREDGPDGYHRQ
jgi:hypothetical protein